MKALIAGVLRLVADSLDPEVYVEVDEVAPDELVPSELVALRDLLRREPLSTELDFSALWRATTADFAGYVDDEVYEDWRSGGYL